MSTNSKPSMTDDQLLSVFDLAAASVGPEGEAVQAGMRAVAAAAWQEGATMVAESAGEMWAIEYVANPYANALVVRPPDQDKCLRCIYIVRHTVYTPTRETS